MKSTRKTQQPLSTKKLSRLIKQSQQKEASIRVSALESLVKTDHPCVFDAMVKALSDKNPTVRVTAVENLALLKHEQAVPYLINKLADSNGEVRMRSVEGLGELLRGRSSPLALLQRLQDRDHLVRIAAAEALGLIGDRKALPALRKALRDASALVRSYASESIGKIGDKGDIARLQNSLKHERSEIAKVGFYHALYLRGQHAFLQELLTLLQSTDYRVRCAVANTLSTIIADETEREMILRTLRKALRQEPTIAARSSIRSSLRQISEVGPTVRTSGQR